MFAMTQIFTAVWESLSQGLPVQVYLGSGLILAIGLIALSRQRAVHCQHLQDLPLSEVEKNHPYIPSARQVLRSACLFLWLLFPAVVALYGKPPFTQEFHWVMIAGTVSVVAAFCILGELHNRAAAGLTSALLLGLSTGFLISLFLWPEPQSAAAVHGASICASVLILISWWSLCTWNARTVTVVVVSSFVWVIPFLSR